MYLWCPDTEYGYGYRHKYQDQGYDSSLLEIQDADIDTAVLNFSSEHYYNYEIAIVYISF